MQSRAAKHEPTPGTGNEGTEGSRRRRTQRRRCFGIGTMSRGDTPDDGRCCSRLPESWVSGPVQRITHASAPAGPKQGAEQGPEDGPEGAQRHRADSSAADTVTVGTDSTVPRFHGPWGSRGTGLASHGRCRVWRATSSACIHRAVPVRLPRNPSSCLSSLASLCHGSRAVDHASAEGVPPRQNVARRVPRLA